MVITSAALFYSISVVGGGDPPAAVLGQHEMGRAVGGDHLQPGEAAVLARTPTTVRRGATAPPRR